MGKTPTRGVMTGTELDKFIKSMRQGMKHPEELLLYLSLITGTYFIMIAPKMAESVMYRGYYENNKTRKQG
jgi:hypothetical protein